MYTFEEYREMVKNSFFEDFEGKQLPKAKNYFSSEEAQDEIRVQYKRDIKKLEAGEITDKVFRNGCVDGTAYTLFLMMK